MELPIAPELVFGAEDNNHVRTKCLRLWSLQLDRRVPSISLNSTSRLVENFRFRFMVRMSSLQPEHLYRHLAVGPPWVVLSLKQFLFNTQAIWRTGRFMDRRRSAVLRFI